jgi:hypothetical protein
MKTPNALIADLFAAASIASVASVGAFAADAAPTAEAPATKGKPQYQMQEKTGAAKEGKEAASEKSAEQKKMSKARHYHPCDGK